MARRRDYGIVIATLLVGYASFYLCRANVDAALPLLGRAYGYDKAQLGRLSSASILAYALGKVVLGTFGDVIGGRRVMLLAIAGSVVGSYAFGLSSTLVALTAFAISNRFFQAGGWGGLVHVVSRWFPPGRHGVVMGTLSTSYELGNVLALVLSGAIIRAGYGWRALFVINPTLFGLVGVFVAVMLRGEPPPDSTKTSEAASSGSPSDDRPEPLGEVLAWLGRKPSFWIALALSFLLTFVRTGFLTWTPTFLAELAGSDKNAVSSSIVKSAVFPAAGVVAALVAGKASDRFGPGKRAPVIAASLAVLVVAVLVLAHAGIGDGTVAVVAIAACGLFLLGPYSLLAGAIALDVAGRRAAATAAGAIDGVGYLGASLAGVVLGTLAQNHGWTAAFDFVAGAAGVAAVLAAAWWVGSVRAVGRRIVRGGPPALGIPSPGVTGDDTTTSASVK